jgi:hypothetical protein
MTELSRFRINSPKVVHETIDGETVLLHLDSGNYYSLDGVGADIWGLIDRSVHVSSIIEWVAGRYRGDRGEIEKALYQLLNELQQEDLIVTDGTSGYEKDVDHSDHGSVNHSEHPEIFVAPVLHKYTDMQDLLLLDPIHDVDEAGWPSSRDDLPVSNQ